MPGPGDRQLSDKATPRAESESSEQAEQTAASAVPGGWVGGSYLGSESRGKGRKGKP